MPKYRSATTTHGRNMAGARALWRATGMTDADFGKLEYCLQAVDECGLTAEDLWFPTMSVRGTREVVLYNKW